MSILKPHRNPHEYRRKPGVRRMTARKPTVGIIGLGPVGSILAAHLVKSGVDLVVQDAMPNIRKKIREDGLTISGIVNLSAEIPRVADSIPELSKYGTEIIFIITKACYLKDIVPELKEICTPKTKIVSFQNGLGNEQFIAKQMGIDTVYRAVINYAGNIAGPGNAVMNWFQPPNYIGVLHDGKYTTNETTKRIARILTEAGLKTEESPDIKKHVWEKVILNAALCSICGVTGQTMKEAMEFEPSRELAIEILAEGLKVSKKDGYDFGSEALKRFTIYLEKGGAHKPSMLIDIENKRPTEVDFMSGAIAKCGEVYKIPTPVNSTFTRLIKTIEIRYSKS